MTETFKLTCHCGAIELKIKPTRPLEETAYRCNCSYCRRRGALASVVPYPDGVEFVKGENDIRLYQFNTNTAEHYFCGQCGNYTHHRRRSNPNEYTVNYAAIEGKDPADLPNAPWTDGVNHVSDRK